MKLRILFLFLMFGYLGAHAQDSHRKDKQINNTDRIYYDKFAIGYSPSAVINVYKAMQFSIDYGLRKKMRLSSEFGYLFGSYHNNSITGYRIKPSFEVLVFNRDFGLQIGFFGLVRNFVEHRKVGVVHFRPVRYKEYLYINRTKNLFGGGLSLSAYFHMSDRIRLEFGGGIGNGQLTIKDDREVNESWFEELFFLNYDSVGIWQFPIIYFNCNFSYVLIK